MGFSEIQLYYETAQPELLNIKPSIVNPKILKPSTLNPLNP